ncbi:MAG: (2Fe-2S)-binding protein [Leptospirales bacterium]|nr:(2Fe-2S)-binding protein [Leptospirales bacterium]
MDVKTITLKVNGNEYTISINSKLLLVEVIRDVLNLTGTKRGCETVSCGACTVLLDGYAVRGCAVLAVQAAGHEITTVEGLEQNGVLAPIQVAFLDEGAFQCGFCTPGMLMTSQGLLNDNPKPTEWQVKQALEGNICRCTGYNSIVRAVLRVANNVPPGRNPDSHH